MTEKLLKISESELTEIVSNSSVEKRYELAMKIILHERNKNIIEMSFDKLLESLKKS